MVHGFGDGSALAAGLAAVGACSSVPLVGGFNPVGRSAALSGGGSSSRPAQHPAAQQQSEAVDIEGQHGEGHHPGEAVRAVGPHPVEGAVLQVVDGGFDRRMLLPRCDERLAFFADAVGPARAPLPGQHVVLEQGIEAEAVRGAVEAAIEAACAQLRVARRAAADPGRAAGGGV